MKEKKSKLRLLSNILFFGILIVILFTPLGTSVKVWVNQLVAMSPSLENESDFEKVVYNGWEVLDSQGNKVDFSDLDGKVVIVNFWATWCPPCIAEKPSFQELYDDYKDKVVFMFITNEDKDKVKVFQDKYNYSLPVFYEVANTPVMLFSKSIPATYVIDKKGNIVVRKFRAADWNSSKFRVELDSLLK
ncbi:MULTISPECIES: TlpA family protein disulfide reductase [Myroides]|uniref:Redoxin domain-containing protein n=1 Tax=Myroides albus TaxID=2562892 RepID=A0A6I3LH58_9FLAO|nr:MULTISPECIES: TlpA disulfide reductase family protein [Myroides]MTG97134.1 redoxin domain-containing protein [Myroides albus]MVX35694.1 redoxin domain-containing protein [Myroides sp. LoEW2-1]UVD78876.1 TlpA family protein disulfide reductase [Myroides albus]